MENQEKIYVGSGRSKSEFYTNISVDVDKIKDHIFEYKGKRYIKLTVGKKREEDDFGKTHYVCIDTYKPDENRSGVSDAQVVQNTNNNEDLPF